MQQKTLITLSVACVLVVIASVYLLTRAPHETASVETLGLDTYTMGNLEQIVRTTPQEETVLTHDPEGWLLGSSTIDTAALDAVVGSFAGAHAVLVARNGRSQSGYGLVAPPYTISLRAGAQTLDLDMGTSGASEGSVYVARKGEDAVYLLEGTTLGDFVRKDWSGLIPAPTSASTTPTSVLTQ